MESSQHDKSELSTLSESPVQVIEKRLKDLAVWYYQLIDRFKVARGIITDSTRLVLLLKLISENEFTSRQQSLAEVWLLYGNWDMKGAGAILQLQDFYPTDEQLTRYCKMSNATITTIDQTAEEEYKAGLRARYNK